MFQIALRRSPAHFQVDNANKKPSLDPAGGSPIPPTRSNEGFFGAPLANQLAPGNSFSEKLHLAHASLDSEALHYYNAWNG